MHPGMARRFDRLIVTDVFEVPRAFLFSLAFLVYGSRHHTSPKRRCSLIDPTWYRRRLAYLLEQLCGRILIMFCIIDLYRATGASMIRSL